MSRKLSPDIKKVLELSGIKPPLIGFYDVFDTTPFKPFVKPDRCMFSCYENWIKGESLIVSEKKYSCQGGGYWVGGVIPSWVEKSAEQEDGDLKHFAGSLNQREGFKSSDELMHQWLKNQKPYKIQNEHVVIGPLKDDQYEYLKTITLYVNPDQLSLLMLGAEYNNSSIENHPVVSAFGSGCGQLAAIFDTFNPNEPKAVIGGTDVAMREHLPPEILAFTLNKPMFEQLCALDENSFLYKSFWKRLRKSREKKFK